ncbi:MAG: 4Fe-4S cluster-binding domain-containing protein, partial [Deltaproteobacteria bacterium]|nr:4Fe-4S cluster-binding domain-containing protein [Deltaproteobacteria bacterium]
MRIGGLNSFSLSDFPGHVAAVVFTQGCNFRCPYCHNGSLIPMNPSTG